VLSIGRRIRRPMARDPLRLNVSLSNFGPIVTGDIQLRPLTVLIGPNNSGKSYASALTRSLFAEAGEAAAWSRPRYRPFALIFGDESFYDRLIRQVRERLEVFSDTLAEAQPGTVEIPEDIVAAVWTSVGKFVYEERLKGVLERNFACKLSDLITIGESRLEMAFAWDDTAVGVHSYHRNSLRIGGFPPPPQGGQVRVTDRSEDRGTAAADTEWMTLRTGFAGPKEILSEEIFWSVVEECIQRLAPSLRRPAHYLPAARSGILQGHRALARGIVDAAPLMGLRPVEVPRLSGLASDFISSILALPSETGPYSRLASEFEARLIHGRIAIREDDDMRYPDLYYEFREQEIPLHRSSSTVSELAPVFLYLKHVVGRGDLLIIEEPEAHLHPENQRLLAVLLVRLANDGLNLLLTTHSEYLLGELNNRMLQHAAQERLPIGPATPRERDRLDPSDLSVFVFREDRRAGGFGIEPVGVDAEEGICDDEFVRVHEVLYEESLAHRMKLAEGKGLE